MSQQGIRSFFNKKENIEPQQKEQPSKKKTTPIKRKLKDDTSDEEASPIIKQTKRRRVLIDSDDEAQDINVSMDTPGGDCVGSDAKSDSAEEIVDMVTSSNKRNCTSVISNVQTPPKRATARKHTGKRRSIARKTPSPKFKKHEKDAKSSPKKAELDLHVDDVKSMGSLEKMEADQKIETDCLKTELQEKMETDQMIEEKKLQEKMESEQEIEVTSTSSNVEQDDDVNGGEKNGQLPGGLSEELEEVEKETDAKMKSPLVKCLTTSTTGSSKDMKLNKDSSTTSSYNPASSKYHPINDACWKRGQKIPYMAIARTFEQIEEESGRLKIIGILTNFLRSVIVLSPEETVKCINLCLNKLGPAYEGSELGIGDTVLIKAISDATGRSPQFIKSEVAEKGDLGLVAMGSRSTQRTMFTPPPLTVTGVFNKFKEIAALSGNSSQSKKVQIIKGLFVACKNSEAKYLMRSLGGKLRIGLAEQSVLVSLSHAVIYTPPSQEWPVKIVNASEGISSEKFKKQLDAATEIVKTAYCELPNYDVVIPALLQHGVEDLPNHCSLTPGIPLKPMLAHPTKGIEEVLKRFDGMEFTCEWKYDGERAQIHLLKGGDIHVYSRNQENNTSKYPDIISRLPGVLNEGMESCVIDSEAVAWDTETKQILPFQVLSTRKRKDANVSDIKVQVCVFIFDLLYLNGESLVREPFCKRRELLKQSFKEVDGEFMIVKSMDSSNLEDIQTFMDESIKGNCEGLMVKTLEKDASYEIAKRSHNWLKLKKDYLDGVGDTLDLVVIGGFHGTGKRTGRYGGFLLACYNEDSEEYQVICKIGTGFKDEDLETLTNFLKDHVIDGPKAYYQINDGGVTPDHWFNAVQVWEVKAADLSISPVYTAAAGIVDPEKGISLRFPRFLRIRSDKTPEQATTSSQVADLYRRQENTGTKKPDVHIDPEDY